MADQPVRYVRLSRGGTVRLGALAGTEVPHAFVPDGHTGTSCLACYGWCNDVRHSGRPALAGEACHG